MSRDIRRTRTGKPVKAAAACGLMCVWMIGAAMTARAEGGLDMHTDYPGLAARAGDNVTFSIEFDNSGSACDASLSIQSMPEGWEGYISGGGNRISRVHVPSGTDSATASPVSYTHLDVYKRQVHGPPLKEIGAAVFHNGCPRAAGSSVRQGGEGRAQGETQGCSQDCQLLANHRYNLLLLKKRSAETTDSIVSPNASPVII